MPPVGVILRVTFVVERQLLNCLLGSSWIVLLTIQELLKAQCNNTDINNTDYSDTDPFLSREDKIFIEQEYINFK